ncbi:hypothetical protein [Streptomyces fuscichromogenes]|nr:hypothetical protein [Streptomyces fuscichromogenes]
MNLHDAPGPTRSLGMTVTGHRGPSKVFLLDVISALSGVFV